MRKFVSEKNEAVLELPGEIIRAAYKVGGVQYLGHHLDAHEAAYKTILTLDGHLVYQEVE